MAHITDLGFSDVDLIRELDEGNVRVQQHPDFPELQIFNYTEDVQFRNRWNKVTLACRGLILNMVTGEVVARPWEKFFNLGQMDNRIESNAPVEVTDKVDGSLGILYKRPDGFWSIATRGSFASEQALHATEVLGTRYNDFLQSLERHPEAGAYTFLFEIVYPENRIVVNYGDMDDLVMLGGVHNTYGYYMGPQEAAAWGWTGPVTEVWNFDSFVDAISFPDRKGKEGVVIRSGTNIVKLKQADYVELHRIVTNLSPKTIWEMLGSGKTIADICSEIPDEFHKYVTDIGEDLWFEASRIQFEIRLTFDKVVSDLLDRYGREGQVNRKKFAEVATKTPYAKYLFLMLDGKDIGPVVWQSIKPRGDVKSLIKDEE